MRMLLIYDAIFERRCRDACALCYADEPSFEIDDYRLRRLITIPLPARCRMRERSATALMNATYGERRYRSIDRTLSALIIAR